MNQGEDDTTGRIVDMDYAAYAAEIIAAHKVRVVGTPSAPAATTAPTAAKSQPIISKLQDTSPVVAFLQGKNCLTGVSLNCFFNFSSRFIVKFDKGFFEYGY